jgi:hypothetical protein
LSSAARACSYAGNIFVHIPSKQATPAASAAA